jgi:RPA family protein
MDTKQEPTYKREPSKRVFAAEFRATKLSKKFSDDEKAPTFVITPTGEIASRILIAGIFTEKEKHIIDSGKSIMYKARLNDGTGEYIVGAGSFQPDAMMQIAKIEPPAFVMVVGKPRLFTTEEGAIFTSVNADSVTVVDKETRDMWKLEAAKATLDRIAKMESSEDPEIKDIRDKYKTNLGAYRSIVTKALTITT